MKSSLWCLTALLACMVLAVYPATAQGQAMRMATASVTLHPNGPEAFSNVPPLSPAQRAEMAQKLHDLRVAMARQKGQVALGPQAAILSHNLETKIGAEEEIVTPSSFYIGKNVPYSIVGEGQSTVAEPSITQSGSKWVVTQNWSRGYSINDGGTFTAIPIESGPSDAPFFCCDQDAVHDQGRDASIWSELFLDSNQVTGVIRLHVRNANDLTDHCSYDLNGGTGVLFDYPHLGVGNNYIYITANEIVNGSSWAGAVVWRYNLDQMSTCAGSLGGNVFTWTGSVGQVVWVPARGTTDTMYLVTIENASQNRYFAWPENSGSLFTSVLNVAGSNYGAANCVGGPSGNNWLADPLSTSSIGFQTRTAVGRDGSAGASAQYLATYIPVNANGGITQAYVAGSIVGTDHVLTASGIDSSAPIFNNGVCISYSDVTANSRGDLGLAVGWGSSAPGSGGDTGPAQSYIAISDDYTRGGTRGYFGSVFLCAGANDNPTRWGDFLTARVEEPVDLSFVAATYGDVSGIGQVRVCEYVRGRYYTAWSHRHNK